MALIAYPVFQYYSECDMRANFAKDLKRFGIDDTDLCDTEIEKKKVENITIYTVLLKGATRKHQKV